MRMSSFLEKFAAYGGDVDGVMDRFMEDEELLMTCLKQFVDADEMEVLKDDIEKKDYKHAFETAHALKGVTGNLGLTPLYDTVCVLVESLRAGIYDHVDEQFNAVEEKRKEFVVAYEQMK